MCISRSVSLLAIAFMTAVLAAGCAKEQPADTGSSGSATSSSDSHSGWWCVEHAIPEEECSMCSASAAAEFKEKGDWCVEHNRAESQCFICHPEFAEKYSQLYEAKYGESPPAPTE